MTLDRKAPEVKGVVAVFVGPDGREIASVSDFSTDGYGGFTMRQAQEHRIRYAVADAVAERFASTEFTKHLDNYQRRQVLDAMTRDGGYKLHIIPIGYDDEEDK